LPALAICRVLPVLAFCAYYNIVVIMKKQRDKKLSRLCSL